MADMRTNPPATHGLLDQLLADWNARGWDPAVLDTFTMSVTPPADGGTSNPNPGNPDPMPQPAPSPQPAPNPNPAPPAGDLSGLQDALDQAAASGQSAALQPLMAAIGVDSPEALQQWVTERHQEIEAGKDEATRLREAAERDAAEARAQAAQAQADARTARVDAALAIAGAPGDNVDDLRRLIDVPADADRDTITAAVDAVKAKYPALFTAPAQTPPAPHSVPPRPGQQTPPPSGVEAGRERARAARQSRQAATKDDLIQQFTNQSSPLAPAN